MVRPSSTNQIVAEFIILVKQEKTAAAHRKAVASRGTTLANHRCVWLQYRWRRCTHRFRQGGVLPGLTLRRHPTVAELHHFRCKRPYLSAIQTSCRRQESRSWCTHNPMWDAAGFERDWCVLSEGTTSDPTGAGATRHRHEPVPLSDVVRYTVWRASQGSLHSPT